LAIVVGILLVVLCVSSFSAPGCKEICLSLILDWILGALWVIATAGLVSSVLIKGFDESGRYWAPIVIACEGLIIVLGVIFTRIQNCGSMCPPGPVSLVSELGLLILNPILAVAILLHLPRRTV
jgi:hypothetical protein